MINKDIVLLSAFELKGRLRILNYIEFTLILITFMVLLNGNIILASASTVLYFLIEYYAMTKTETFDKIKGTLLWYQEPPRMISHRSGPNARDEYILERKEILSIRSSDTVRLSGDFMIHLYEVIPIGYNKESFFIRQLTAKDKDFVHNHYSEFVGDFPTLTRYQLLLAIALHGSRFDDDLNEKIKYIQDHTDGWSDYLGEDLVYISKESPITIERYEYDRNKFIELLKYRFIARLALVTIMVMIIALLE